MKRFSIAVLLVATLSIASISALHAQNAQQRREELVKIQEMIKDPDPMMRIANFEAIAKEQDKLKTELAIKLAMTSQDSSLRSLATGAYFGIVKAVSLDFVIPAELKRRWDEVKEDRRRREDLTRANGTLYTYDLGERYLGGRVRFIFTDTRIGSNAGQVAFSRDGIAPERAVPYRVLGERIVFSSPVQFGGLGTNCDVELRGTKDLTIVGTLTCHGNGQWGPIALQAAMF